MLISCIMPTSGSRRSFVSQAIRYFNEQDFPEKELVIVDECDPFGRLVSGVVPRQDNIRYVALDRQPGNAFHITIGAKRNLACSLARGEIICHFDDDDYYAPHRLSQQAQPLLKGEADITGLSMDIVANISDWEGWQCSPTLHKEIFANDVHGGTLMYHNLVWGPTASFSNQSSGEDGNFLRLVRKQGACLEKVENAGSFVYIRHGENLWPLPPHHGYPHMHEWQSVPLEQHLPANALAFYKSLYSKGHNSKTC